MSEARLAKIYKQPFTERKWSLTKASIASRILHKITFGKFGAIQTVELKQREMVLLCTGAPCGDNALDRYKLLPLKHYNCRCSIDIDG